ncbi:MAG: host attachment protein [Brevundimonas sp.]|uniref:host attachment family protein n=1 Tax=Brevundimonas sp. TaxID=1871086 RepID=UPI002734746C|nr:host attachment protein [Brevundimonas sp.]MDP3404689.1 host attachment protein [Brevundimonas sp.]
MILPNGAMVAVVDGEKLALFKNTGHTDIALTALSNPEIEDRASGSPGRHSSGANPDNDTQAEDGFAMGVAEVLNKWALGNKFDDLVVIAAPKTLGELRKHWHKELSSKLVGEIAKDLTGHSTDQIAAAIHKA